MKKLNLYGGAVLFMAFAYSGYVLHHFAITHANDSPVRIGTRANHLYLLLIVLLNLLACRVDFCCKCKMLEAAARSTLLLSGLCAAAGFFLQASRAGAVHNVMSPIAIVLAFLAITLFLLDGWRAKK